MKLEKLTEKDTIVNDDKIGTVRCTRVSILYPWLNQLTHTVRVDCYDDNKNEYISVSSELVDMPDSFHIEHALPLLYEEIKKG